MVRDKTIKEFMSGVLLGIIGFLIYSAIINIFIYFQYGLSFTPELWLLNPIVNLVIKPNVGAWIIFLASEIAGLILFERK